MQTGEAHFTFPVPYEVADVLKAKPDLEVVAAPSIVLRYLSMNTQQKPFDNPKVRQAIAYAINKEALAKVAFNGYATPAEGVAPQGVEYAVKMGPWPYDVAKAKQLLTEAGYPNGFETELWSAYNHTTAQKVTQFLQQQLQQIGIKHQDHAARGRPARREGRELAGSGDRAGAPLLRRLVDVDRRGRLGAASAALRRIVAAEALQHRLLQERQGRRRHQGRAARPPTSAEKAKLYKDAQETIWKDAPWAPLVVEQLLSAHNKKLTGVYVMPDASFNFWRSRPQVTRRRGALTRRRRAHGSRRRRLTRRMLQYIVKRLLGLLPTLLLVGVLVFLFVHLLPGDPARLAAGPDATPETVELVRKDLGLDKSAAASSSCASSAASCTGTSAGRCAPSARCATEIAERFMPTFWLTVWSMAWSVVFGMTIGIVSAVWRNRWPDRLGMTLAVSGISFPGVRARHGADADLLGAARLAADRRRRHVAALHPAVAHARRGGRGDHGALHALVVRRHPAARTSSAPRARRASTSRWSSSSTGCATR